MSIEHLAELADLWLRNGGESEEEEQPQDRPTDRFNLFPALPAELRHEIWETAAATKVAPNVCVLTVATDSTGGKQTHKPLVVRELCNEGLESASREARASALKVRPRREYNPDTDILYLGNEAFDYLTNKLCGRCDLPWAPKVRHLAIPVNQSESGLRLPIALGYMSSLETLSIVYPQTTGKVDCWANVPPPPEQGAALRELTEKEMGDLMVTADYTYDTWHSPCHIKWTKSVREHLDMVTMDNDRRAAPSSGDRIPALWDSKKRRLRLRYRAMCFVS